MEWVVEDKGRLDQFLVAKLAGPTRSRVAKHISDGRVRVNSTSVSKAGYELHRGDVVETEAIAESTPHSLDPVHMDLSVPYEDDDVLVVNKPRGLNVHPGSGKPEPTLVHGLLARGQGLSTGSFNFRPGIVHRLDKDTTGLMMVAKNDRAHTVLSQQIKDRTVDRHYVAVARQSPSQEVFTIDAPLGRDPSFPLRMKVVENGRRAVTHVRILRRLDRGTLVLCKLETGRTHQIRVHLAHYGYEVIGDRIYASPPWNAGPLQLHATYLAFDLPSSNKRLSMFVEPPADFIGRDFVTESEVESWI